MAALYIAAAWLILQVTDTLTELLQLPPQPGTFVVFLLAVGFPVALTISWFYELTPEGLILDKDVSAGTPTGLATGRRIDFIIIAVLSAALLVFVWDKWWREPSDVTIAVVPLASVDDVPDQHYFAEQMTDLLIAELTKIDGLIVQNIRLPDPERGASATAVETARQLGVDAIVEGSTKWTDSEVFLNLRLVDGDADRFLWAEQYRRNVGDVFDLLTVVTHSISDELVPGVAPDEVTTRTVAPEALRAWIIGNEHLRDLQPGSFDIALRNFERAAEIDSGFAHAYAGIAQAYAYQGSWHGYMSHAEVVDLAIDAAREAVRLDPDLAEAHFALAFAHKLAWDWETAEREFRRGSELNPSDSIGLIEYANFLALMGKFSEAVSVAERAVAIDPLAPTSHNELGLALQLTGDPTAALARYRHAEQLDPDFFQTRCAISQWHVLEGNYDEALPYLNQLWEEFETHVPETMGFLGANYAYAGQTTEARHILNQLLNRAETEYISGTAIARVSAALGERDMALDWLEVAYEQRVDSMIWLREDPWLANLHGNPRFEDLLSRMSFPEKNPVEN